MKAALYFLVFSALGVLLSEATGALLFGEAADLSMRSFGRAIVADALTTVFDIVVRPLACAGREWRDAPLHSQASGAAAVGIGTICTTIAVAGSRTSPPQPSWESQWTKPSRPPREKHAKLGRTLR